MTAELTGLELRRKACEALGWTKRQFAGDWFWYMPDGTIYDDAFARMDADRLDLEIVHLPAIESDPAVSEPIFLEWLKSRRYRAEMTIRADGEVCIDVCADVSFVCVVMVFGSNPCEARALAIVAASAKENARVRQ